MNNLCADIGWQSYNKYGETLCGDNVEIVDAANGTKFIVLADGMGSGVKANILSKLTAKIVSTMMAAGLQVEDCVETIAATLPVCKERCVAYSTFTIIALHGNEEAEIIQYDNPGVILLRDGGHYEFPSQEVVIGGKKILKARVKLQENDVFIMMSDGCIHAGVGIELNFGWQREDIISYMETFYDVGFTAKSLNSILLEECYRLYGGEPGDDTTACTIRIRKREPMSLVVGPPSNRDDDQKMMSLFFSKEGKHIVCGGSTSIAGGPVSGQKAGIHPGFRRSGNSAHRQNRGRGPGDRGRDYHQQGAHLRQGLPGGEHHVYGLEQQAGRRFPDRPAAV